MILRDHFALPVESSNEVSLPVRHDASTSPELRGRCGVTIEVLGSRNLVERNLAEDEAGS